MGPLVAGFNDSVEPAAQIALLDSNELVSNESTPPMELD